MKLRRIDILGFKSFRNRTSLEIADGVTAIVGPNGCGKSNVIDAIRWCIGSQSARDLRGREMSDVIFAGSEQLRPTGFAEVSLTLENDRRDAIGEWRDVHEIKVTRRLFRTGESEYEINGTRVRLRDIHELFLGTGVGARDAYSIIEQGRIGFIVAAPPSDRRIIIEEAAGITRYRFQRKQAEKRLDQTRENLLRVADIIAEVTRQLGSLERQAKRAAEFRELDARRRRLELTALVHKRDALAAALVEHAAALDGLRGEAVSAQSTEQTAQARIETARIELVVRERRLTEATEAAFRSRAKADLLQNNLSHRERERRALIERIERLATESQEQDALAIRLGRDAGAAAEQIGQLRSQRSSLLTEVETADGSRATARDAAVEAGELSRKLSESLTKLRGERAQRGGRLDALANERASLTARRLESNTDGERLVEQLDAARVAATAAAARKLELAEAVKVAAAALDAARRQEQVVLTALQELQREQRDATRATQTFRARAEGIDAQMRSGRSHGEGVRRLLDAASTAKLSGLVGPLADRLRSEAASDAIVATLLGPWLHGVIFDSIESASRAAKWARDNNVAATILAFVDPHEGRLADGVNAVQPVPGAVARLFAETTIAADATLATADVPSVDAARVRHVAPGVWIVESGGQGAAEAVLRLGRERDEVAAKLAEAVAAEAAVVVRLTEAEATLEVALKARSAAREADAEARTQADAAVRAADAAQREVERLESAQRRAQLDRDSIDERLARLERDAGALATESAALDVRIDELLTDVDAAAARLAQLQLTLQTANEKLGEIRVLEASVVERLRAAESENERLGRGAVSARERAERAATELQEVQQRIATLGATDERERKELDDALEAARVAAEEQIVARTAHETTLSGIRELEVEAVALRRRSEHATGGLRGAELQIERTRTELELADAAMEERFKLTLGAARKDAEEGPFTEQMRAELDRITARVDSMGPVNTAAEDEFREASERARFMSEQKRELESAMADLESAIRKMDKTSKDLFATTFEEVNQRFQELFPRLFRGGRAHLELTDPENLLETGVEIVVQPPGKRLQSMTLLSGGEKALSAVALIFAIFQMKPTPFCILDEVDAPLDEANVVRFAEMVTEMSATSQFLIISHNKRTMEVASTLYGVTMEEPGVSKVVGVRLQSNAEAAAERD